MIQVILQFLDRKEKQRVNLRVYTLRMKLLVPTDFSPYSDRALELATLIAKKAGGEITLLNVIYDPRESPVLPATARGSVAEGLERTQKEHLARLKEMAGKNPLVKKTMVEFGEAHQAILAQEASCDMMIMGTKGIHGLSGALVGSVAMRVLRKARVPVITVREKVPKDIKKIVAATDTSEASGKALNAALALAKAIGAEMIPVYVDTLAQHVRDGSVYWQRVVDRVAAISSCPSCVVYPSESPSRGIMEFSKKEGADLVAIGTMGLSGLRDIIGSTAVSVVSASPVPVMVV